MNLRRKQRKHRSPRFEIEALRTLLDRSRWTSCMVWLLIELVAAALFVVVLFWLDFL